MESSWGRRATIGKSVVDFPCRKSRRVYWWNMVGMRTPHCSEELPSAESMPAVYCWDCVMTAWL